MDEATREFFQTIYHKAPKGTHIEVAYGSPASGKPVGNRDWKTPEDILDFTPPPKRDTYYGPAPRSSENGTKESVAGTSVLWVDLDKSVFPGSTLLPSFVVGSGHGYHLYWVLEEWLDDIEAIETLNKILAEDTGGDEGCWNANRLLRIPGSNNFRGETPTKAHLERAHPDRRYRPEQVRPVGGLDKRTRHKIRTGDSRGYRSRSERDWAVICNLVDAEAPDDLIKFIFATQPIGDKYREDGDRYLDRSVAKARDRAPEPGGRKSTRVVEEREDGYYVRHGRNSRRVSTFIIRPQLLLEDVAGGEDAVSGDVAASGHVWNSITFTRSAFQSVVSMSKETPYLAWQWLGSDQDVRHLLPHLLKKLEDQGLPKTHATRVLGLHRLGDTPFFVGTDHTLGSGRQVWDHPNGPLVYVDPKREHPVMAFSSDAIPTQGGHTDNGDLRSRASQVRDVLPNINEAEVIWPFVGWYAASVLKPAFEQMGYRFPILNVHGTRGSGKTTTIQRVMMPLFGQKEPKSYDAGTTRFVTLSILGSSNAVPVAFSEFRFGSADEFLRYVLLSYDTGHDPRGRADQTTVDYPLSAPFSVDGEDLISDPAAKQRIIPITMHPHAIEEGSEHHAAHERFRRIELSGIGQAYIHSCLQSLVDDSFQVELRRARDELFDAYPKRLPDRVRNNFIVVRTGIRLWCRFLQQDLPEIGTLGRSLQTSFDMERQRAPVIADEMVEDLVNAVATPSQNPYFKWHYDSADRRFWFQLASAHSWWVYHRRRQARGSLERDAIRIQLEELEYTIPTEEKVGTIMHGVDLKQAQDLGLDVPSYINRNVIEF